MCGDFSQQMRLKILISQNAPSQSCFFFVFIKIITRSRVSKSSCTTPRELPFSVIHRQQQIELLNQYQNRNQMTSNLRLYVNFICSFLYFYQTVFEHIILQHITHPLPPLPLPHQCDAKLEHHSFDYSHPIDLQCKSFDLGGSICSFALNLP